MLLRVQRKSGITGDTLENFMPVERAPEATASVKAESLSQTTLARTALVFDAPEYAHLIRLMNTIHYSETERILRVNGTEKQFGEKEGALFQFLRRFPYITFPYVELAQYVIPGTTDVPLIANRMSQKLPSRDLLMKTHSRGIRYGPPHCDAISLTERHDFERHMLEAQELLNINLDPRLYDLDEGELVYARSEGLLRRKGAKMILLTPTEQQFFEYLWKNEGHYSTSRQIRLGLWDGLIEDSTPAVWIHRLQRKLATVTNHPLLVYQKGLGYKLDSRSRSGSPGT